MATKRNDNTNKVLDYLVTQDRWSGPRVITAWTRVERKDVSKALKTLSAEGMIENNGRGGSASKYRFITPNMKAERAAAQAKQQERRDAIATIFEQAGETMGYARNSADSVLYGRQVRMSADQFIAVCSTLQSNK